MPTPIIMGVGAADGGIEGVESGIRDIAKTKDDKSCDEDGIVQGN